MRSTRDKSETGGRAPKFDSGRSLQPMFWWVVRWKNIVNRKVLLGWEPNAVEPNRDVVRCRQLYQGQKSRNPMVCETRKMQPLEFIQRNGRYVR